MSGPSSNFSPSIQLIISISFTHTFFFVLYGSIDTTGIRPTGAVRDASGVPGEAAQHYDRVVYMQPSDLRGRQSNFAGAGQRRRKGELECCFYFSGNIIFELFLLKQQLSYLNGLMNDACSVYLLKYWMINVICSLLEFYSSQNYEENHLLEISLEEGVQRGKVMLRSFKKLHDTYLQKKDALMKSQRFNIHHSKTGTACFLKSLYF